ncbi:16078_t:CDS:2, partial [Funneliformis caledonium]
MLSESDDVWASDEEISEYDRIMSLKEWERMNENFGNVGYKEGILEGKDVTIQDGFNDGYVEGVNLGMEFGRLRGLL